MHWRAELADAKGHLLRCNPATLKAYLCWWKGKLAKWQNLIIVNPLTRLFALGLLGGPSVMVIVGKVICNGVVLQLENDSIFVFKQETRALVLLAMICSILARPCGSLRFKWQVRVLTILSIVWDLSFRLWYPNFIACFPHFTADVGQVKQGSLQCKHYTFQSSFGTRKFSATLCKFLDPSYAYNSKWKAWTNYRFYHHVLGFRSIFGESQIVKESMFVS